MLIVCDVDGTLTDGRVLYPGGQRFFNVRDGHGFFLAQLAGFEPIIMSGENDPSIESRCEKLGVRYHLGIGNKYDFLAQSGYLTTQGYIAISDDIPDIELLQNATLAFCPADAHPKVLTAVTDTEGIILTHRGGYGCVREMVDMLIEDWLTKIVYGRKSSGL